MNAPKVPNQTPLTLEQMIEMIDHFNFSTQFFYWLVQDDLQISHIVEKIDEETYERIVEYRADNLQIYYGRFHVYLSRINSELHEMMKTKNMPPSFFLKELVELEKTKSAEVKTEFNYTIISQLFYHGQLCGSSWEIFELPNIIKIYEKRKLVSIK